MLRWHGVADVPADWHDRVPAGCVVTIGVFDGVHAGHAGIVRRTVESARRRGVPAVVITFHPHPSEVVRPGSQPARLSTLEQRAELLAELGVDALLVLEFTPDLSRQTADDFVRQVLVDGLHAVDVVVGENFRYGHRAAGNVATLRAEGERWGFTVDGVPLAAAARSGDEAGTVSSTRVRALVAEGDVAAAALLLGRPHRVEGTVVRGDQRGRQLGYPTANLECPPCTAIPADGVYAGYLVVDGDGAAGRDLGRHQPDLRRLRAHGRGVRDRADRPGPVRQARGGGLPGPDPRPGEVRLDGEPDQADEPGRPGCPSVDRRGLISILCATFTFAVRVRSPRGSRHT